MGGVPVVLTDKGVPVSIQGTIPAGSIPFGAPGDPAGPLDASGKIPTSQLPVGDVNYIGNWNAATNTPTLAAGVGTAGDMYICDVAGTQNLGNGSVAFAPGDWVIYDGAAWDRVAANGVTSANPSVTVGLTAKNGTAATFMRSDAAPALDQAIVPTWTGAHTFSQMMTTAAITASGNISTTGTETVLPSGGNGIVITGTNSTGVPSITTLGAANNITLEIKAKGAAGVNVTSPLAVTGTFGVGGNSTFGGNMAVSGTTTFAASVAVAGTLGSGANTSLPSPTNSGISIGGAPTYAIANFYDQAFTANNRTAQLIWINNSFRLRFANDTGGSVVEPFFVSGGHASGITGIASNSGSGAWAHTGPFSLTGSLSVGSSPSAGTAGQILTSAGAGVAPTWQDSSAGTAGTYAPTVAASLNVASAAANGVWSYIRVGNVVHVSGRVDITATAAGVTLTSITLPVASTISADNQVNGHGIGTQSGTNVNSLAVIYGDINVGSNKAILEWTAADTVARVFRVSFQYTIQ